ncbi:hypothetical protein OU798_12365 [Prolixibacteraceae bacterium Z1-6]|uniref:Uncharacterized protein n=1 Tax=Draconibacterium aestuarii TaxID=2998507 RepID=A0A9X3F5Z7_9BACT|nr:hypothetical protein [Prolixibacteraceae bacterium Z1-6]
MRNEIYIERSMKKVVSDPFSSVISTTLEERSVTTESSGNRFLLRSSLGMTGENLPVSQTHFSSVISTSYCHLDPSVDGERSVTTQPTGNRFLLRSSLGMTEKLGAQCSVFSDQLAYPVILSVAEGSVTTELTGNRFLLRSSLGMTEKLGAQCSVFSDQLAYPVILSVAEGSVTAEPTGNRFLLRSSLGMTGENLPVQQTHFSSVISTSYCHLDPSVDGERSVTTEPSGNRFLLRSSLGMTGENLAVSQTHFSSVILSVAEGSVTTELTGNRFPATARFHRVDVPAIRSEVEASTLQTADSNILTKKYNNSPPMRVRSKHKISHLSSLKSAGMREPIKNQIFQILALGRNSLPPGREGSGTVANNFKNVYAYEQ